MALTTPICDFGWKAVDFDLPGVDGRSWSLAEVRGERGTLVMFICNHCPYVRSKVEALAEDIKWLQGQGLGAVAIMSNDTVAYPDDSFDNMKRFAGDHGFTFPYVLDETQDVARAYDAVCTPEFFGFNADLELQYRGRFDESGKETVPGAHRDLREAMTRILETGQGPAEQHPSIGCSIKWRADG